MNKLLAETVSFLNGLFAVLTVIAYGIVGKYLVPYWVQLYAQLNGLAYSGNQTQAELTGIVLGLLIGFIWAIIVHGLLALFIQIHRELKGIRKRLTDTQHLRSPTYQVRAEPRMPALAVGGLGK